MNEPWQTKVQGFIQDIKKSEYYYVKLYEELSYTLGALLEDVELKKYMTKLGQDNMINPQSIKTMYLVERMRKDEENNDVTRRDEFDKC